MSDMGTFRTTIQIASHARPDELRELVNVLVDTGSELTWLPREILESLGIRPLKTLRFRVADGRTFERQFGYAIIHVGGTQTTDEVAFGEAGDMVLLGARAMEGLNLRVEPRLRRLVDAGPIDAAYDDSPDDHFLIVIAPATKPSDELPAHHGLTSVPWKFQGTGYAAARACQRD